MSERFRFRGELLVAVALGVCGLSFTAWMLSQGEQSVTPQTHGVGEVAAPPPNPGQPPDEVPEEPAPTEIDLAASLKDLSATHLFELMRDKLADGSTLAEIQEILNAIAKNRPEVAMQLARTVSADAEETAELLGGVAAEWASRDPQAAWRHISYHFKELDLANGSLPEIVFNQMAREQPALVVTTMSTALWQSDSPNGVHSQRVLYDGILALIRAGSPETAKSALEEWTKGPLNGKLGASAFEAFAFHLSKSSPHDAGEWLRSLPPGSERNFALGTLASDWVERDGAAAMKWAEGLKSDEGRAHAIQRTFNTWTEYDPAKAAAWLIQSLPKMEAGIDRDGMVATLIHRTHLTKQDPEGALEWANMVNNPKLRTEVFHSVLARWVERDPKAAKAYITRSSELTAEQKQNLLYGSRVPVSFGDEFEAE